MGYRDKRLSAFVREAAARRPIFFTIGPVAVVARRYATSRLADAAHRGHRRRRESKPSAFSASGVRKDPSQRKSADRQAMTVGRTLRSILGGRRRAQEGFDT